MTRFIAPILVLVALATVSFPQRTLPKFADYPVTVYTGRKIIPRFLTHTDGCWREELGYCTQNPKINFAGKYFIFQRSCGSYCGFFRFADMSTGREFDLPDPKPNKKPILLNGPFYTVDIFTRKNSRLLIAQFHSHSTPKESCSERSFVLIGSRLKSLTKTFVPCRRLR